MKIFDDYYIGNTLVIMNINMESKEGTLKWLLVKFQNILSQKPSLLN